ncbi:MAG TPA: hypothetical protein VF230_00060 [Acidimicrobiales bacterium]
MGLAGRVSAGTARTAGRRAAEVRELRELAGKVAPVVLAGEQVLPVDDALAPLLPGGGLRRGSVVAVDGPPGSGATSLLLRLVAGPSAAGSWVALVGMPSVGAVAAAEAGVDLSRLALVPAPGGHWPMVTAALLDAIDVVVVRPPTRFRAADARRLAARTRERGGVLVVVGNHPDGADVRLTATGSTWRGLGAGHGVLASRTVDVVATGRGAAARERRLAITL